VVRGGSFFDFERNVRCACRNSDRPTYRYRYMGFRCVVAPVPFGL
jgi:formylglycine-generating enzyme required for sulfatase activity